jgi:hypothetical protein
MMTAEEKAAIFPVLRDTLQRRLGASVNKSGRMLESKRGVGRHVLSEPGSAVARRLAGIRPDLGVRSRQCQLGENKALSLL